MQMMLKIEANEIEYQPDLSYYNNICYKLKRPYMGITHFVEKYDDVSVWPDCIFGIVVNGKFKELLSGEMDQPIENTTTGGLWYSVYINCPESFFLGVVVT